MRFNDCLTPFSASMVYILFRSFGELCWVKPCTSCAASPERLLLARRKLPLARDEESNDIDLAVPHLEQVSRPATSALCSAALRPELIRECESVRLELHQLAFLSLCESSVRANGT